MKFSFLGSSPYESKIICQNRHVKAEQLPASDPNFKKSILNIYYIKWAEIAFSTMKK
jgi:hypothetical protein